MKSCGVINMKKILTFVFLLILLSLVGQNSLFASGQVNVQVETYLNSSTPSAGPAIVRNIGQKVNVTNVPEGYEFKYYAVNGIVRDDLPFEHEFNVRANMKLTVIFAPTGINERHVIVFADANGQILEVDYVVPGQDVTFDGTMPTKPQATANGFITSDGLAASLTNIQSSAVYFVNYTLTNATDYTLTVTGATKDQATYKMNEVATVTANEPDPGKVFSHFEDANGHVLSTKPVYKFTVLANTSVTAIFADEVDGPEYEGVIVNMSNAVVLRTNHVSYKGQFELPTGYELVEYGFIFSRSSDVLTLTSLGATVVPSNVHNGQTGEFLRTFPDDTFNSIRAYVTYKNGETVETVYSENNVKLLSVSSIIYQTGFETGTKTSYTTGSVTQDGVSWVFNDALLGTDSSDRKEGTQSVRMRNSGFIESGSTFTNPTSLSFKHGIYGGDAVGTLSVSISNDKITWHIVKNDVSVNSTTLTIETINFNSSNIGSIDLTQGIYIRISKTSGNRINVDALSVNSLSYPTIHEVKYDSGNVNVENVVNGNQITNTTPTRDGFAFDGWYTDSAKTIPYVLAPVNQSFTLYAKWIFVEYSIQFVTNGGTAVDSIDNILPNDVVDKPTDPTKTDNVFDGWFEDEALTIAFSFSTAINKDYTLYAKWIDLTSAISVSDLWDNYETTTNVELIGVVVATTDRGYILQDSTSAEMISIHDTTNTPIKGDEIYLTGIFSISFEIGRVTTVTKYALLSSGNTINYSTTQAVDIDFNAFDTQTYMGKLVRVESPWIQLTGTGSTNYVKLAGNQNGLQNQIYDSNFIGSTISVYNSNLSVLATTAYSTTALQYINKALYIFLYDSNADYQRFVIIGDQHIETLTTYEVSFDTDGGSSVASQTIVSGRAALEPSDPTWLGYNFEGWYTDDTFTTQFNFSSPINANTIVYALWDPVTTYTVTFYDGATILSTSQVNEGDVVIKPADPTKTGYTFKNWYTDTNYDVLFNFATLITADASVYADWTENTTEPVINELVFTFNSKSWGATSSLNGATPIANDWTSGKDGLAVLAQGLQVNTGTSGANGTSTVINNIISIEVIYATNASNGVGTIVTSIGGTQVQSFNVLKPSSGGTTPRSAGQINVSNLSGAVTITVTCTTNSVFINSIIIRYSE